MPMQPTQELILHTEAGSKMLQQGLCGGKWKLPTQ